MKRETPTFYQDGFRRVKCPHCRKYVGKADGQVLVTRLTTKTERAYECCHCKGIFIVYPPLKTTDKDELRIIKWGPNLAHTTADLTAKEIGATVPA